MKPRVMLALTVGVAAVSFAAVLVRLCDAPPLSIAAWRLTLASVPVLAWRAFIKAPPLAGPDRPVLLASGVALALHFATWISSLSFTTVASSVAIVTTQPVWVALFSALWLKEKPRPLTLVGMAVALAGSLVIAGVDLSLSPRALMGDGLALLGALFAAVYLVAGRRVRGRVAIVPYLALVYPVAAALLLFSARGFGSALTGFSDKTWLFLLLLAWVPQLIGHSLLNWSLEHASAALVSIAILGEPVFATLLAIPLLGETPGPVRAAGGLVVLVGVALAVKGEAGPSDTGKLPVPT